MIRSHYDACKVLGLGPFATQAEIKAAYKNLVKQYHPDAKAGDKLGADSGYDSRYYEITEAYQFLTQEAAGNSTAKVIGGKSTQQKKREEQEAYDRWYQRRKEEKAREFEARIQKQKEEAALQEKQDREYREAMEKINTIILAESLKRLIHQDDPK